MGEVVNTLGKSSRADKCEGIFCDSVDIQAWGNTLRAQIERARRIDGGQGTPAMRELREWTTATEPYAVLGQGTALGARLLSLYGPVPMLNSTVVNDLARRAEDGDELLKAAAKSINVPHVQPGSLAGPITHDVPWGLLILFGLGYLYNRNRNGNDA